MCADRILLLDTDKSFFEQVNKALENEYKVIWYVNQGDLINNDLSLIKLAIIGIDSENSSLSDALLITREIFGLPVIVAGSAENLLTINKNLRNGFEAIIKKPSTNEMISQTVRLVMMADESMVDESPQKIIKSTTISLSFNELERIARELPATVLTPEENYFVVSDVDKINELPPPTIVKDRPFRIDTVTISRLTRALGKKYGGLVNINKKKINAISFNRDSFFNAFLVNSLKSEFDILKRSAGQIGFIKDLIMKMEDDDYNTADSIMLELFNNFDVANHFFTLKNSNNEPVYRAISRHIVHSSFVSMLLIIKYIREAYPEYNVKSLAKTAGLAVMMKEYGAEKLFTSYTIGSMEFIREWTSRITGSYDQLKILKTMKQARHIFKSQHALTLHFPIYRFGLLIRFIQIATTLDTITNGFGVVQIGPYTESFREGSSPLNACYNMIVHSRKPRHSKDYEHVYEDKLVAYIFKTLNYADALNYQKLIADVRSNRCGKAIITPNEIQPVSSVCPFTEGGKLYDCSGCSVKVNSEYRGEQYRTCVPAHKEITQINSDFYDKRTKQ